MPGYHSNYKPNLVNCLLLSCLPPFILQSNDGSNASTSSNSLRTNCPPFDRPMDLNKQTTKSAPVSDPQNQPRKGEEAYRQRRIGTIAYNLSLPTLTPLPSTKQPNKLQRNMNHPKSRAPQPQLALSLLTDINDSMRRQVRHILANLETGIGENLGNLDGGRACSG